MQAQTAGAGAGAGGGGAIALPRARRTKIVPVAAEATPLYDSTNGIVTAVAKCTVDGEIRGDESWAMLIIAEEQDLLERERCSDTRGASLT